MVANEPQVEEQDGVYEVTLRHGQIPILSKFKKRLRSHLQKMNLKPDSDYVLKMSQEEGAITLQVDVKGGEYEAIRGFVQGRKHGIELEEEFTSTIQIKKQYMQGGTLVQATDQALERRASDLKLRLDTLRERETNLRKELANRDTLIQRLEDDLQVAEETAQKAGEHDFSQYTSLEELMIAGVKYNHDSLEEVDFDESRASRVSEYKEVTSKGWRGYVEDKINESGAYYDKDFLNGLLDSPKDKQELLHIHSDVRDELRAVQEEYISSSEELSRYATSKESLQAAVDALEKTGNTSLVEAMKANLEDIEKKEQEIRRAINGNEDKKKEAESRLNIIERVMTHTEAYRDAENALEDFDLGEDVKPVYVLVISKNDGVYVFSPKPMNKLLTYVHDGVVEALDETGFEYSKLDREILLYKVEVSREKGRSLLEGIEDRFSDLEHSGYQVKRCYGEP